MLCRFLFSAFCLLLLLAPAIAQQNQREDSTETETELTYQPPLVPIELSVNSEGEAAIKLAPKCVTPLGTFGVGKGVSAVSKDNNTYIVFRAPNKESVYCIGTHGKLRLRPEGKPTIVIEHDREHANTIIVDIDASHGTVKAEFIPDNSSEFLAEMPETRVLTSFYLAKNGDVFNGPSNCKTSDRRHIQIRQADIYDVIFCDFDGKSQFGIGEGLLAVTCKGKDAKTTTVFSGVPKDSMMAARWMCYSQKQILKKQSKIIKRVHSYNDVMHVFDDGSFFNGVAYTPATAIKSFDLDTSSLFGASINVQCTDDWHLGKKTSLGFYSDKAAKAFYQEMKKLHDSGGGK